MLKCLIICVFLLLGCTQAAHRRDSDVEKVIENKDIVKRQVEITCGKNKYCETWQKKGFCENTFYPLEFREKWCGVPCGLCTSNENDATTSVPFL